MSSSLTESSLLDKLSAHPLMTQCFSSYVRWICKNAKEETEEYDLIGLLLGDDSEALIRIESRLANSRDILGVDSKDFAKMFGFTDDLLTKDPEKVYDILAEPLLVPDLYKHGFEDIEKIRKPIRSSGETLPTADFLATRYSNKFAIELKTTRMERIYNTRQTVGDSTEPGGWVTMFLNNAITKIENKDQNVIKQLINTAAHYKCSQKMLVLYTRRVLVSTLLFDGGLTDELQRELERLKTRYPQIDYFCAKDLSGEIAFFPKLLVVR